MLHEFLNFKYFITPRTDEYILKFLNEKVMEKSPFFEKYEFYLLPTLHNQAYREIKYIEEPFNKRRLTAQYLKSVVSGAGILDIVKDYIAKNSIYQGTENYIKKY